MARRARLTLNEDDDPELDISSLIDVSFLLLIYFIVTSTLQKNETDMGIELPSTVQTDNPDEVDPLAIEIDENGVVTLDGIEMMDGVSNDPKKDSRLPELRVQLREHSERMKITDKKAMVVLVAHDDGKTQRFVDVINALAEVEITSITMTGFRPEDG